MSFKDIFKKSFLEGFASAEITTATIVVALGIACALALYIFFVYRIVTRKTFYSKNFNISLAGITVITAALILTMQMLTRRLRPVVIVEYDRIPYVYENGNVRITLDTNICSCSRVETFLAPELPRRPVMALGQQLLEVKYDEYLPDFIYRNLQLQSLRQSAFSKYYICRKFKV